MYIINYCVLERTTDLLFSTSCSVPSIVYSSVNASLFKALKEIIYSYNAGQDPSCLRLRCRIYFLLNVILPVTGTTDILV